tara:strand:- start:805 stop:4269 length:3465 start_codon:yes stop_codon:yes gene_type:complete
MFKNLLPPMDEEKNQIPSPSSSGVWNKDDYTLLSRIRDGLKNITIEEQVEDIISIPDVWARIAIVKNALSDVNHPLHYQIKGEWRGLLAIFALLPYHKKNIETIPVNLIEMKNNPLKGAQNNEGTQGNFAQVLTTVNPGGTIAQGQNWDEIGIIKLENNPIGLLVPNTIVAPAKFYSNSISQGIDWFQGGKFIDPCETSNIQPEQFLVLIKFIDEISNGLKQTSMADINYFNTIQSSLDDFKKDCQSRINENESSNIEVSGYKKFNISLKFPQQPIYSFLNNIYEFDTGGKVAYSTLLKPRNELENYISGIILIDENIPYGIGKTGDNIRIWNTNTIETISNDKKIKKQVEKEITKSGYLYLYPEELFTKKLCIFHGEDKIVGHLDKISNPYLLPFNPIILSILTPSQIRNNFQIMDKGESYTVSLKLQLHNHLGEKVDYDIRKEYSKDEIEENKSLPVSSFIWPNFIHPSWKQYFLFYSTNPNTSIAPRTVFSIEGVIKELQNHKNSSENINFLNSLKDKSVKLSNRLPIREEAVALTELHLTENPPEALICDGQMESMEFIPSHEREPLGIAIINKPESVTLNNSKVGFGIDFGTTNTNAYMQKEGGSPKVVNFLNRIYSPFTHNIHEEALIYSLRDFIPNNDSLLPFLTIARDRNISLEKNEIEIPLPIWSALIYYVSNISDALADIVDDKKRPLHFNLKWSKTAEDRERVKLFLSQIVLQCLCEGLAEGADPAKISWNFSYPESFSPSQLRDFKDIFKVSLYAALQPFEQNISSQISPFYKSESLSSALYFASNKSAPFTESVVTIDIGGHTSDISIWQNRKLLWRNSMQIAGRHILINFLNENPSFIEVLAKNNKNMKDAYDNYLVTIVNSNDKIAIRNAIEVIVNSQDFEKAFRNEFLMIGGENLGHNLRLIGNLALSGILFYTGQLINYLIKEKNLYDPKESQETHICLGGRASLLYKVLLTREHEKDGLATLFAKSSGDNIDKNKIIFTFTDDPKHEVSHGLLVDAKGITDFDLSKRTYDLLLGEDVEVGRDVVNSQSSVNDLDLEKQLRIIDLKNVKYFQSLLKETMGISFDMNRKNESGVSAKVNTELVNSQADALEAKKEGVDIDSTEIMSESSRIEPPFIVALKEILERISRKEINIKSSTD